MTLAHRSAIVGVFVTALGIAVGCSSDSGPTGPKADCILPTTSNFVDSAQGRVVINNLRFVSEDITIRKGMAVRWVYCETPNSDPHTVTSDAGLWDSGLIRSNEVFTRTFATVGTYAYHCTPHPEMQAVITVVD
jgi:plastocyanin